MQTVDIAGKEYEFKFFLAAKREIEDKLKKSLWEAMWSGLTEDLCAIVAVGLRHANKSLNALKVEDMLQAHIDKGGDVALVHKTVNRAVIESNILGRTDPGDVERVFRKYFEGVDETGPKAEPETVRAQE